MLDIFYAIIAWLIISYIFYATIYLGISVQFADILTDKEKTWFCIHVILLMLIIVTVLVGILL